ncbi:unnamed protein product [Rotaria socialis]|uniref:mitogen-activated protein kinase kinase n=1 Tax=Rotaria socialis TaxID=392032 RepID=A0A820SX22_9BILA|nr:unnamed protein product [Rotaria socialis]
MLSQTYHCVNNTKSFIYHVGAPSSRNRGLSIGRLRIFDDSIDWDDIPSIDDKPCQKQMLTKLDRFMRENTRSHILQFYGALCHEIVILNRICRKCSCLYHICSLGYLKSRWNIIRPNVKPLNILVSRTAIKLFNSGITNTTFNQYPRYHGLDSRHERIDPIEIIGDDYDERSDVWSLGLTIYELSTGYYPFEGRTIPFDNMKQIVFGPSLELTLDRLSDHCKNFLNTCLNKDRNQRSKYEQLLKHPFLQQESESQQMESIFAYFPDTIDRLQQNMNESK